MGHWIAAATLDAIPELPDYIYIEDRQLYGRDSGGILLSHRKNLEPSLAQGHYKTQHNGKLIVIRVGRRLPKGMKQSVEFWRPSVRVPAKTLKE